MIGPAHYDNLHALFDLDMRDDEVFDAHYEAKARHARLVERPCVEGNCVELYDPETEEIAAGWGACRLPVPGGR